MATAPLPDPVWDEYMRFRHMFADVLDPDYYPLEWLDGQIWSGKMRLFTTAESAIIVSIKTYPSGLQELVGEVAAGELRDIVSALIPQSIEWAKSLGCRVAEISSRPAWSRIMRNDGWDTYQVTLKKWL